MARAWCHQVGDGRLNGLLHRALAELAVWQGRYDDARREVDTGLELLAHTGDPELAARIAAVGRAGRGRPGRQSGARGTGGPRGAGGDGAGGSAAALVAGSTELAGDGEARNAHRSTEALAALLHRPGRAERAWRGPPGPRPLAARRWPTWDAIGFPYRCRLRPLPRWPRRPWPPATTRPAAPSCARPGRRPGGSRARPLATAVERLARRGRVALAAPAGRPGGRRRRRRRRRAPASRPARPRCWPWWPTGRTNRQIGEELFISEKTASVHVSRLLAKLGAATRGEAAAVARRQGLLDDGLRRGRGPSRPHD